MKRGFIFYNSLESKAESGARSGAVVEAIKPVLDPKGKISEEIFEHYVRKAAHMTEFGTLGMLMFGVLFVAALDEFVQSFTGRGSLVSDVLVDFAGGTEIETTMVNANER